MKTLLRLMVVLVFVSSTSLFIGMAIGIGRNPGPATLRFEPNPLTIPIVMRPGQEYNWDVAVVNDYSEPASLVGVIEYCSGCCYSAKGVPVVIPARGQGHITVHIAANEPCELTDELTFFTDRPAQPKLVLKFAGKVEEGPSDETSEPAGTPLNTAPTE